MKDIIVDSISSNKSGRIHEFLPDSVITKIYAFITNKDSLKLPYNDTMTDEIENYIDSKSQRWIYSPILRSKPESRYIILLLHYFDRRPGDQLEINSILPTETLDSIAEIKKSFKLGC